MTDIAISRSPDFSGYPDTNTRVKRGAFVDVPFPTMESVNADYTDFNQAVALYNRRTNQAMATPDVQPYFDSPDGLNADGLTALRTKINTLRTDFALSTFMWTQPDVKPGYIVKKHQLDELFSALNFGSPTIECLTDFSGNGIILSSEIVDNPYGTFSFQNRDKDFYLIGKIAGGVPHAITRYRAGFSFEVPAFTGLSTPLATQYFVYSNSNSAWLNALESWNPVLYGSNTDDSGYPSGWQNNLNVLLGSGAYDPGDIVPGGTHSPRFNISYSFVQSKFGSTMSVVAGSNTETTGTGAGADSSGVIVYAAQGYNLATEVLPIIKLDYGFDGPVVY